MTSASTPGAVPPHVPLPVLALLGALLGALATPAAAQQRIALTEGPLVRPLVPRGPGDPLSPHPVTRARIQLAPVSVNGSPGSLEVVGVPVPAALRDVSRVRYAITPVGRARLFGRTVGALGEPRQRPATVMVTIAAPALAIAGPVQVAVAEFDGDPTGPVTEVPILMHVAPVRRVEFTMIDRLTGALRGDVATLRYRVVNFGNRPDTVSVDAVLPAGWQLARGERRGGIALPVRAAREGQLRLWVPPSAAVGASLVHVVATSGGAAIASVDVNVEVRDPRNAGRSGGPALTLSAATATIPGGRTAHAVFATLEGPLTDSIRLSARGGWSRGATDGDATAALARLGGMLVPPTVTLAAPSFDVGLGLTGGSLSELTGYSMNGIGASGGVRLGAWRATAIAARPYAYGRVSAADAPPRATGLLAGGTVERAFDAGARGDGVVTVTASRLVEPQLFRRLDAAAVGATFHSLPLGDVASEFGYRRFDGGSGLGWNTRLVRQGPSGTVDLRLLHAPGGTRAYARAASELSAAGTRVVRPWMSLAGSYWASEDENATFGSLASRGWSLGPRFSRPSAGASLAVELHGASFDAASPSGRFGNAETQLTTMLDARRGAFFGTAYAAAGRYTRTVGTADVRLPDDVGTRGELRGSLGVTRTGGATLEMTAGLQRYGAVTGVAPRQGTVGARVDRLPIPVAFGVRLLAGAEVQRSSFGIGTPVTTSRASLSAPLPAGFSLTATAERNPYLFAAVGGERGRWMTALRLERTSFLPRLTMMGGAHRVYRDLNGNGVRDGDEPGIAHVVMRCGDQSTVTDRQGRFKCGGDGYVDPRSVPAGMIAPTMRAGRPRGGDVGLVSVSVVRVRVVLAGVDTLRVPAAELAKLLVIARDSTGQPWIARLVAPDEQQFDALPPGRYSIDADATAIAEPLVPAGRPEFVVGGGPAPTVELRLHGRAVKVRQLPATFEQSSADARGAHR